MLHYRVRILQISSETPSPSSRRVAAIREAKEAFLGTSTSNPNSVAGVDDPISSMTSSIVVADVDGTSSSSFEHVDDREKSAPKPVETKELNVFEKELSIGETTELRSPALLSRFNSIPKPPRHSLERSVTVADVEAMQPLLTTEVATIEDGPAPNPPTTPMPKEEKAVAFAKTIVN